MIKLSKTGKYIIQILFKNSLTNTQKMFYKCSSLTSLNLSYFNNNNIIDMSYMFSRWIFN